MTAISKKSLRRAMRQLTGTAMECRQQSKTLCRHILQSEIYQHADIIAGYSALPHEADITDVLKDALRRGKMVLMPLCGPAPDMEMRQIFSLEELEAGRFGIPQPKRSAPAVNPEDADLILVPLEAVDRSGYRLGKGGGYYDKLLSGTNAHSMGCAFIWQIVDEVPRDAWDKPLNSFTDIYGVHEFEDNC